MNKGHVTIGFALKILGIIVGCIGFYVAAFVEPRIGGILIALGSILIAIPAK